MLVEVMVEGMAIIDGLVMVLVLELLLFMLKGMTRMDGLH